MGREVDESRVGELQERLVDGVGEIDTSIPRETGSVGEIGTSISRETDRVREVGRELLRDW